jgi:tetratricopeptide (TPR) repeat protein
VGLFSSEARRERRLQNLQDTSNRHAETALLLWRAGRSEEAVIHNQQALDVIRRLRAEEPHNEQHLAQLAGKLYNHAGMLTQSRRFAEAATAARACLDSYLELTGGEVSPEAILGDRLMSLSHSLRPALTPRGNLAKLAAMTADAKGRLASILAVLQAPGFAEEALRLSAEAVATYKVLVGADGAYRTDLARVQEQCATVRQLLGEKI